MPETTRWPLIEIAKRYGVVACVSGRRASDARRIVSIGSISYLGSHGTELLRAGWTRRSWTASCGAGRGASRTSRARRSTAELRRLRVRLEDKGSIAALPLARRARRGGGARPRSTRSPRAAEQAGLSTHWGRKVLEVRPPVRIDKGAGIVALLRDTELDAALYVGDDATDLDAFRGLGELHRARVA